MNIEAYTAGDVRVGHRIVVMDRDATVTATYTDESFVYFRVVYDVDDASRPYDAGPYPAGAPVQFLGRKPVHRPFIEGANEWSRV